MISTLKVFFACGIRLFSAVTHGRTTQTLGDAEESVLLFSAYEAAAQDHERIMASDLLLGVLRADRRNTAWCTGEVVAALCAVARRGVSNSGTRCTSRTAADTLQLDRQSRQIIRSAKRLATLRHEKLRSTHFLLTMAGKRGLSGKAGSILREAAVAVQHGC